MVKLSYMYLFSSFTAHRDDIIYCDMRYTKIVYYYYYYYYYYYGYIANVLRMSSATKILCSSKILGTEKRASADNCGRMRMLADLYKHDSRIMRMFSEYQPILCAIHAQYILNASVTGPY